MVFFFVFERKFFCLGSASLFCGLTLSSLRGVFIGLGDFLFVFPGRSLKICSHNFDFSRFDL